MAAPSGSGSVPKPEVKSEVKTEVKTEIKDEPDASPSVDTRTYIRIKDEDDNNDAILKTIPNHDENDMFDDVDGEEVVDLTYEGIAHINDVRHFVCEGLLFDSGASNWLTGLRRFQDSSNPRTIYCQETVDLPIWYALARNQHVPC
jgi:hypothetical protein